MLWHFKEKTRASEHWSTQILSQHLTGRVYIWVSLCPYWLGKEMAIHFSTLAWKIPWTEERGGLQSTGSQRVRHNWVTSLSLVTTVYIDGTWKCTASWEIPQTASLLPLYDISYWVYSTRHPLWNWHLEFTAEHRLCFLVLTFTSPPGHETLPHSFICLMKRQWSSNLVAQ